MNVAQTASNYEYQFVGSTKEQRVKEYDAMVANHEDHGFFTPQLLEEYQAKGKPLYYTFKCGDDVVRLNALSKGDKELSEEQLKYLKETYDMENMSNEDKLKMLGDLTCFGVIPGKQAFSDVLVLNNQQRVPDGWTSQGELDSDASRLRGADSLDEWLDLYSAMADECGTDIVRLMSDPYAPLSGIQAAQSKRDYYERMKGVFGML